MKHTSSGYLRLGRSGQPGPEEHIDNDDLADGGFEEFLGVGTGVEDGYHSCEVVIQYKYENNSQSDMCKSEFAPLRSWTIELCAPNTEQAKQNAIREFRLIESIAGRSRTYEIHCISVNWKN